MAVTRFLFGVLSRKKGPILWHTRLVRKYFSNKFKSFGRVFFTFLVSETFLSSFPLLFLILRSSLKLEKNSQSVCVFLFFKKQKNELLTSISNVIETSTPFGLWRNACVCVWVWCWLNHLLSLIHEQGFRIFVWMCVCVCKNVFD